jgi:hemoglobin
MTDITTRSDIKILVDTFYGKVRKDELLGPVFSHVDWPHHLPIMYNFWSSIVLGDQSYSGSPMAPHLKLNITAVHFNRWLILFIETVDQLFAGLNADEIKLRAQTIAKMFQHKMGLLQL